MFCHGNYPFYTEKIRPSEPDAGVSDALKDPVSLKVKDDLVVVLEPVGGQQDRKAVLAAAQTVILFLDKIVGKILGDEAQKDLRHFKVRVVGRGDLDGDDLFLAAFEIIFEGGSEFDRHGEALFCSNRQAVFLRDIPPGIKRAALRAARSVLHVRDHLSLRTLISTPLTQELKSGFSSSD